MTQRRRKDLEKAVADMQTVTASALRREFDCFEALTQLDTKLRELMEKKER